MMTYPALRRLGAACAAGFAVLAVLVQTGLTAGVDNAVHDGAVLLRTPWLTPIARALSDLMTPIPLIVIGVCLLVCKRTRRLGGAWAFNVCVIALVNVTVKALVQRPRPDIAARLVDAAGFSFPSGHSAVSMAAFGLLAWFAWHEWCNGRSRVVVSGLLVTLAVLVGASRVYLGVHYLSDVAAGFCEAGIWLACYISLVGRWMCEGGRSSEWAVGLDGADGAIGRRSHG